MDTEPKPVAVALGLFAVALVYWGPAFFHPSSTGFGDWQMVHHNWEVGWVSLTRYGEFPLWDPFHCGGITMWGNPEAQHLSPFFFLSLLTGTTLAIKIMVVVHAWLGLLGTYVLARREHRLSAPASLFAALLWACSGFFAWQIGAGHGTFVSFYLLPWVLLAWRRAVVDWRMSAVLALLMGLVAFEGGTYPFPYFVLLLAFDAGVLLARRASPGRVALAAGLSGALTLLLSAVRWIPSLITLSRIPRNADIPDAIAPWEIVEMLGRSRFPWEHAGHPFVWPEYSAYIGITGLVAGLLGIWAAVRARRYEPLAALVVFGLLIAGQFAAFAPWSLIHQLPVYRSLRVPSRFSVLFTFYFALLAGFAIDTWLPRILARPRIAAWLGPRPRLARGVPWLIVALLALDPFNYGVVNNYYHWRYAPIDTTHVAKRFHLIGGGAYGKIYASLPRRNIGTPACYVGNLDWPISGALWLRGRSQVRITEGGGRVLDSGRTVNTAWARVNLLHPGRIVFNQNFDRDWHASEGEVTRDRGRLAVDLPAGRHEVTVTFEPPRLRLSLFATGLGGLACLVLLALAWARRRRSRPEQPPGSGNNEQFQTV